jgi:ribosomal protein S12 methylthiotransferase accessory factor
MLPTRPRFKAHLTVRVVGTDKVFLVAEDGHHLVRGEAAAAVVPYLDGHHTTAQIVDRVRGRVSFADCVAALTSYHRFGHITGTLDGALSRPIAAAWEARGVDPTMAAERLAHGQVRLAVVGAVDTGPTAAALEAAGLRVHQVPWQQLADVDSTAAVVLTDEYLDGRLADVDAAMRRRGRPWLLAKPTGTEMWLGPYFRPGHTGCWHCLSERLDGNRPVGQYLRRVTRDSTPIRASVAALPSFLGVAAHLVAGAVATVVAGASPVLEGRLVSLDTVTLAAEHHQLVKQPQCRACGDAALWRPDDEVRVHPDPVDASFRVMPAEKTLARLDKHVSRLLGAVTKVHRVPSDPLVHSYVAGHNFAVQADNIDGLRRTLRGQSGGKGRTDTQAQASAVCEAIERYCGVWRPERPTTVASYADLGPERTVDIGDVLLFSPAQYAHRTGCDHGRLHRVPMPLEPSRPIAWSAGWSLTTERVRLLPAAYAWFGHPDLRRDPFCFPDANGNAAGNTVAEAVLHGFLELVERDGVALWWYNRVQRPAVDLDDDPYANRLREFYAGQGRELWVLDLTADLAIPTFAAVSRRVDHPVEDVLLGFGAHLDARLALSRALTELNQFLPAVSGRGADGAADYHEDDPATLTWWRDIRVADQPWLLPDPAAKPSRLDSFPHRPGRDLADSVRTCVESARAAGLEVIVFDQSRPDIELAVVKVVVPGLRHFWRRLGPGRLYDVPVALGWLDTATAEADCNPLSVFF